MTAKTSKSKKLSPEQVSFLEVLDSMKSKTDKKLAAKAKKPKNVVASAKTEVAEETQALESAKTPKNAEETQALESAEKPVEKPAKKTAKREPATPLMKVVAEKAPVIKKMQKSFSTAEMDKILKSAEVMEEEKLASESKAEFKRKMMRIKRLVLEMEAGNNDKLIFYQSSPDGQFYKALNTSALYYSYRLAHLMGRKAAIMVDNDRHSKAAYVASLANMEKFVQQYYDMEGLKPEITVDGVYIFPLKKPLADDEIAMLKQTEQTKRDSVHRILKPKQMNPAIYQQILLLVRQLAPRSEKLKGESVNFRVLGEEMLMNLRDMMVVYADYSNGVCTKEEAAERAFSEIAKIKAALTILGETRKWGVTPLVAVGSNIETLEILINKDLERA